MLNLPSIVATLWVPGDALVRASEHVEDMAAHNARVLDDIDRSHRRALAVLCVPVVAFLAALVALIVVVAR